jgi:uncharacterized membrane protein
MRDRLGKKIFTWLVKGLVAILPVALTLYIIYWIGSLAESFLGGFIKSIIKEELYAPGMGLVAGFFGIILTGYLIEGWLFRNIFYLLDRFLKTIPVVKAIYVSILSMVTFFDFSKKSNFNRVVLVRLGNSMTAFGLVTKEDLSGLLPNDLGKDQVAVFIPISLQMAGLTVFMPKEQLIPVDIPVEKVVQFNLTAGISY